MICALRLLVLTSGRGSGICWHPALTTPSGAADASTWKVARPVESRLVEGTTGGKQFALRTALAEVTAFRLSLERTKIFMSAMKKPTFGRLRGRRLPVVKADHLVRICATLLQAAGASEDEAQAVANGCVNANLAGHDSHGVIVIPRYIDLIKAGEIVPGAELTIVQESPTTAVIDGGWGFGFHVSAKAMALIIEKAKDTNIAACTVFRQSHVGRLAGYSLLAARAGMIGFVAADSGRSRYVAPFGGREPRLGTNPISIAVPSDLRAPFLLDMATSAVALGKIHLAAARGEDIPKGWMINAEGQPTNDPCDYYKGGALLPLGGNEGYKGSALAAMVDVLCGLLTGLSFGVEPSGRENFSCFMAVLNVAAFRSLDQFKEEVGDFARYLKSTPPLEGTSGVFYPGEIGYLREQERAVNGIEIEGATWEKLRSLAHDCGLARELDLA